LDTATEVKLVSRNEYGTVVLAGNSSESRIDADSIRTFWDSRS
jgi:hypothetical protein